jgi:hypothetical protein
MAVVIYGNNEVEVDGARWRDGEVWLPLRDLPAATGWEVKPEGVCAGDTCIPAPPGGSWADGELFNLSAFARHVGVAEAADPGQEIAAFVPGDQPAGEATTLAPDFTLPDLDGAMHSLSDYRGRKVVLLTWASF